MDDAHYASLNDQTQLINKALKYTNGNIEKATQMAAGLLQDVAVVKCRIRCSKVGAVYIFMNVEQKYIININSLITTYFEIYNKIRIFDAWKQFYNTFGDMAADLGGLTDESSSFTHYLTDAVEGYDLYEPARMQNIQALSELFQEIIDKYFSENTDCQVEIEKTTSLILESEGIPMELPERESEEEEVLAPDEMKMREIESQVEFVVPGSVILSPVKGKNINEIKQGERIVIMLNGKDAISDRIARMFNAIAPDGKYLPVKARVKEKMNLSGGGYALYALVARNVLVKIVEEENVKIEIEKQEQKKEEGRDKLLFYVALLIGMLGVSIFIVLSLL